MFRELSDWREGYLTGAATAIILGAIVLVVMRLLQLQRIRRAKSALLRDDSPPAPRNRTVDIPPSPSTESRIHKPGTRDS